MKMISTAEIQKLLKRRKVFRVNLQLPKLELLLRRSYLHLDLYFHSSYHLNSTINIPEVFQVFTVISV